MKKLLSRLLLLLLSCILALFVADRSVAFQGLDQRAVAQALYYQAVAVELHEVSEDPILHYTLKPGARLTDGPTARVSINDWGARGPAREVKKPEDTRRVLVFGGSTVYGVGVADDQTLPAYLERALAERLGGPVEAWNFGTSAYVLSQSARLARNKLREIPDVDAVVVIRTNTGRRAFLQVEGWESRDYSGWFEQDPYLYLENFHLDAPLWGLPEGLSTRLHFLGLSWSAFWRYKTAREIPRDRTNLEDNPYTAALARAEGELLAQEAAALGVPVVYALYPLRSRRAVPQKPLGPIQIDLWRPDQVEDFYNLHPAAEILAQHAERLADRMVDEGVFGGAPAQ